MDDPPRPVAPTILDGDPDDGADDSSVLAGDPMADDPTGRLAAYLARTQNGLDVLALLTLWIVVVPVSDLSNSHDLRDFGLLVRIALSIIYGIDMAIRTSLAQHHWRYLRHHPLGLLAVLLPPVRVLFSLRLIRVLFRRGNLDRFLIAALVLLLNGALIVFLFERDAPGANINSLGQSIWWSIVTVTTVGYGDYYPVTVQGRVVATFIMLIGIITVAVITAQVASSFVDQTSRRAAETGGADVAATVGPVAIAEVAAAASTPDATEAASATKLDELEARLERIEQLLVALQPSSGPGEATPPS